MLIKKTILKNERTEKKKANDNNPLQGSQKHGITEKGDNPNNEVKKEDEKEIIINEVNNQNKDDDDDNTSDYNLFSNDKNRDYCSISLEFPSFASPMIYSQNCSQSYRDYLQIKYKTNIQPKTLKIKLKTTK